MGGRDRERETERGKEREGKGATERGWEGEGRSEGNIGREGKCMVDRKRKRAREHVKEREGENERGERKRDRERGPWGSGSCGGKVFLLRGKREIVSAWLLSEFVPRPSRCFTFMSTMQLNPFCRPNRHPHCRHHQRATGRGYSCPPLYTPDGSTLHGHMPSLSGSGDRTGPLLRLFHHNHKTVTMMFSP